MYTSTQGIDECTEETALISNARRLGALCVQITNLNYTKERESDKCAKNHPFSHTYIYMHALCILSTRCILLLALFSLHPMCIIYTYTYLHTISKIFLWICSFIQVIYTHITHTLSYFRLVSNHPRHHSKKCAHI